MFRGRVGAEIEHGSEWPINIWSDFMSDNFQEWDDEAGTLRPGWRGWEAKSDSSVHPEAGCAVEITTRPYETTAAGLAEMMEKVRFIYGKAEGINRTCGLHFHLSFLRKPDFWKLCSWDFVEKFQKAYLARFTADYERVRRNNTYCGFYPDKETFRDVVSQQLRGGAQETRYKAVNFKAFNSYGTVEFRVFPGARTFGKFGEYLTFLLRFVSHYLRTAKDHLEDVDAAVKREAVEEITVVFPGDGGMIFETDQARTFVEFETATVQGAVREEDEPDV